MTERLKPELGAVCTCKTNPGPQQCLRHPNLSQIRAKVNWKTRKVEWRMSGTFTYHQHPDEGELSGEDIKRIVEEDAGDLDILARSEIDGLTVTDVDDEHVHNLIPTHILDGAKELIVDPAYQLCTTCWAKVPVPC